MGKLIVIEGVDCSGKETQSKILAEKLEGLGYKVKLLSFPNYSSPACGAVNMYLNGEFGENANDINPYSSSLFFAVDRLASFYKDWKDEYECEDTIFIADRYTASNWIHQASKFDTKIEAFRFINFSKNLEFNLCELPEPDMVFFLKLPFETINALKAKRNNKINGTDKLDIHESNDYYMKKSYLNALEIAMIEKWSIIECESDSQLRSIDNISSEILELVEKGVAL